MYQLPERRHAVGIVAAGISRLCSKILRRARQTFITVRKLQGTGCRQHGRTRPTGELQIPGNISGCPSQSVPVSELFCKFLRLGRVGQASFNACGRKKRISELEAQIDFAAESIRRTWQVPARIDAGIEDS